MRPCKTLLITMIAASLCGCTHSSSQSVNLALTGIHRNAGQIGRVTLTDVNNQTNLNFYITGVPTGTLLPPRVFTFIHKGSCQQPGAVAYALNDQVNTKSNAGTKGWGFYRSAPVPLATLLASPHSIVLRSAPSDGDADIFCGDIAAPTRN